jgi:4-oxalocrotonate tautomerase
MHQSRFSPTSGGQIMPFANYKVPQRSLSAQQKEEIVQRTSALFAEYFGEGVKPYTMVLIEEVVDGGYGRADEVFKMPSIPQQPDQQ